MSNNPTTPIAASEETTQANAPKTEQPSRGAPGEFNASTSVASMEDLRTKAPTVYKAMMEGIAMNIVNEMKDHQQRLKELQRQAQRDAEGKS